MNCIEDLFEDEESSFFREGAVFADEVEEVSDVVDFFHDEDEGRFSLEEVDWLDDGFGSFGGFELEVDFGRNLAIVHDDVFGDAGLWNLLDDDSFSS